MATGIIKDTKIYMGFVSTGNYTAAANGGRAHGNLKTLVDSVMPQDCECLGIVGFNTGSGSMLSISARYDDSDYAWDLRNVTSNSVTSSAAYWFLYRKK